MLSLVLCQAGKIKLHSHNPFPDIIGKQTAYRPDEKQHIPPVHEPQIMHTFSIRQEKVNTRKQYENKKRTKNKFVFNTKKHNKNKLVYNTLAFSSFFSSRFVFDHTSILVALRN